MKNARAVQATSLKRGPAAAARMASAVKPWALQASALAKALPVKARALAIVVNVVSAANAAENHSARMRNPHGVVQRVLNRAAAAIPARVPVNRQQVRAGRVAASPAVVQAENRVAAVLAERRAENAKPCG